MSFRRDGDRVTIELTTEQYHTLLLQLGYAMGAASARGESTDPHLRLVNAINEGNPNWTPYAVEPELDANTS